MNLSLERVVYISQSTNPDPALISLAEILAASDRNNRRDRLTGALLVSGGQFLQVLEGAQQDLNRMLAKLEDDPRHRHMRVLSRTRVDDRLFGQWTMVASRISPAQQPKMMEIIHLSDASPTLGAQKIFELVKKQLH